jgi:hypothetical protein
MWNSATDAAASLRQFCISWSVSPFTRVGLFGARLSLQIQFQVLFRKPFNEPRDIWSDRQKHPVAHLKDGQRARHRRNPRSPAPMREPCPNFDECRRARENTTIARANMEPRHHLLLAHSCRCCRVRLRDIDKAKIAGLIFASVIADFCPAKRAGSVKI